MFFGVALKTTGEDVIDRIAEVEGFRRIREEVLENRDGVVAGLAVEVVDGEALVFELRSVGLHGGTMENDLLFVHRERPAGIGAEEESVFEQVNVAFGIEGRVLLEELMRKNKARVHLDARSAGSRRCLIIFGSCDFQERG